MTPQLKQRPARLRRSQAERRSESEQGLLQAAITVVVEDGVGAFTFDAVGRLGGFSRGLATVRFGSKQGLIDAVITHLREHQDMLLAQHGIDNLSGFEAILAYVDFCLRDLTAKSERRAYFMLLSSAVADASEMRAAFAKTHARIEQLLAAWVLRGQAEGDIRREIDAQAAALMIGSLIFGVSMQCLVDPQTDVDPICETSLAMLRLSLGVR